MKIVPITKWQVEIADDEKTGQLVALDGQGNKYTFYCSAIGNLDVICTEAAKPTPRPVTLDFAPEPIGRHAGQRFPKF